MPADSPEALAKAFGAAMSAGDVAGAMELWVEDATIVGADGEPVRGRDEIALALGAIVDHEVKVDIRLAQTFTAGDTALVLGHPDDERDRPRRRALQPGEPVDGRLQQGRQRPLADRH